jgi:hypothetical protein
MLNEKVGQMCVINSQNNPKDEFKCHLRGAVVMGDNAIPVFVFPTHKIPPLSHPHNNQSP